MEWQGPALPFYSYTLHRNMSVEKVSLRGRALRLGTRDAYKFREEPEGLGLYLGSDSVASGDSRQIQILGGAPRAGLGWQEGS